MQLHTLKARYPNKKFKIIGRGGKRGKTSGKGGKGQTARAGHRIRPEVRDMIKKLPKLRGRGKNIFQSIQIKPNVLNVGDLEKRFEIGAIINPQVLNMGKKVKILGDGEVTKKFVIENCAVSATARKKILAAGGLIK